jgi:CRP-like cAMP-binding protein
VRIEKRLPTGSRAFVCNLAAGAVFGEISAIQDRNATADVRADTRIRALVIPKDALRKIADIGGGRDELEKIAAKIMVGQYLASSTLFKELPPEVLHFFVRRGNITRFARGAEVARQGDTDRTFFLLLRGRAGVFKDGKRVGEVVQGGFFGEIALMAGIPRTASVAAEDECLVLGIGPEALWEVFSENLELSMLMESVAESRLGEHASSAEAQPTVGRALQ